MTTPTPSQDDLKALEQTRQRLQQLANSMTSLRRDLDMTDPLPSWPSLLNAASLISHNLSALSAHLSAHTSLFTAARAYPLPSFPGRAQEGLLQQLLRKKLEPEVDEWVGVGEMEGSRIESAGLKKKEREELWSWAAPKAQDIARRVLVEGGAGSPDDDGEEDEDDEDADEADEDEGDDNAEKMDVDSEEGKLANTQRTQVSRPMLPLEDICRFVSTGALPGIGPR